MKNLKHLTNKQKVEIEVLCYFVPLKFKREPSQEEIKEYFEWSEQGKEISESNILKLGKQWRDAFLSMYKDDIWMYGCMIFFEDWKDAPLIVKEDLEKRLKAGNYPKLNQSS